MFPGRQWSCGNLWEPGRLRMRQFLDQNCAAAAAVLEEAVRDQLQLNNMLGNFHFFTFDLFGLVLLQIFPLL